MVLSEAAKMNGMAGELSLSGTLSGDAHDGKFFPCGRTRGASAIVLFTFVLHPIFHFTLTVAVCDALVEGIRASLREEMPMAMACFRTVFPCFMRSLRPDERAVEFSRVFQVSHRRSSLGNDAIDGKEGGTLYMAVNVQLIGCRRFADFAEDNKFAGLECIGRQGTQNWCLLEWIGCIVA